VHVEYEFEVAKNIGSTIEHFEQVVFHEFQDLNLGFYRGELWLKLQIQNKDEFQSLMFVNKDLFNRNYRFYKFDEANQLFKIQEKRHDYPQDDYRTYNHAYPNFAIDLQPNEKALFLITMESDGRTTNATPELVSIKDYQNNIETDLITSSIFISIIIFLLFLNTYLWRLHRNNIYLIYMIYMIATVLMYLGFEGFLYKFHWNPLLIDHVIFLLIRIWVLSLVIFTFRFLGTRRANPLFYKWTIFALCFILIGNTIFQFSFYKTSIAYLHFYENVLSFLWIVIIFVNIILAIKTGGHVLKYYITPLLFFIIFIVLGLIDGHFRIFPGSPFVYIKIGTLIEFIGFTYFMTRLVKDKIDRADDLEDELKLKSAELLVKNRRLEELNRLLDSRSSIEKTDLINIFTLLENELNTDSDWEFFKEKFSELNPKFLNRLLERHGNLTKTEVRLLTLIKIGYTQKEIARILNIAPDSVKKARGRVRKKIQLDSSVVLNDYLDHLTNLDK
jgi:DNA-binding CsgD family transcriptional regulator